LNNSSETNLNAETIPDQKQIAVLFISILIVALCGIAYELIIGTVSSYLLGNSVYQFSLTIGLFMFAMGIGSFISRLVVKNLITSFVIVELLISVAGGISSLLLFIVFPYVTALYLAVMYSLIIIIGILVGLEIPILTRILSRKENLKDSIANVLTLDYVGALAGSILFPLFLLPHLGLIRSSFAIGLINSATALVNIIYFRKHFKRPFLAGGICCFAIMMLIVMTVYGTALTNFAEGKLYFDQVLFKKQTQYQRIVYTEALFSGEHRLYIDGHIQFCDRDEYRYHEALVHPVMTPEGRRENVLILGGGDGLAAREVLKYAGVERIHLVDIDPDITKFCSEFPAIKKLNKGSLKDAKVKIINTDAFSFLNQYGILYDRIIIDLPDPHNEALNKLYSREFYTIIRKRLNPTGFMVTQSSSPFYTRTSYWCIENTLENAGFKTFSYKITVPAFGLWGFHIGTKEGRIPERFDIKVPTRFIDESVMSVASVFGRDVQKVDAPVNTMMEPKLYELYLNELKGPI